MSSGDAERRARFDVLARATYAPLRRYLARRTDPTAVDDVLADTLLVMWRRLDDVPAVAALPWCYGAARRCLANARRAEGRRRGLLRRLAAQPHPDPEPVWATGGNAGPEQALSAALAALSGTDRDVLRLWAWEQLEPREMAVVLGITANAASIRLHRATKRLRDQLGATDDHGADGPERTGKTAGPSGHTPARQDGPHEDTEAPR
ncbi:MAG: sigma-70 family RNA polymerase sigma factor [Sporichthyaceae bacterium]